MDSIDIKRQDQLIQLTMQIGALKNKFEKCKIEFDIIHRQLLDLTLNESKEIEKFESYYEEKK